jgi:hypothetical protein
MVKYCDIPVVRKRHVEQLLLLKGDVQDVPDRPYTTSKLAR